MPKEKERSYVFSTDKLNEILYWFRLSREKYQKKKVLLEDSYLDPNLRIRQVSKQLNKTYSILTHKKGKNKLDREENECSIENKASEILRCSTKLKVSKYRSLLLSNHEYIVTLDEVFSPINILILEIESANDNNPPCLNDFVYDKNMFIECPLTAWDYHNRTIGICGAPSSGKTSTAQKLCYDINTKLGGNAFHVHEYATTFLQKYDRMPVVEDQLAFLYSQKEREQNAKKKADITISDSPVFMAYIYSLITINKNNFIISKLYKRALESINDYTDIVFMELVDFKNNNIRYGDKSFAQKIESKILYFLYDHEINFKIYNYNNPRNLLKDLLYIND